MIYVNCHFTKLELELIERSLIAWRCAECPTDADGGDGYAREARAVARGLCFDLVERCRTYREALRKNQEREQEAEASGQPF